MFLDLVTPTKKLVEHGKVANVILPTINGEVTLLPNHADMLAVLGTGVLRFQMDGVEKRYAVSYGFVDIRHDHVTVLAETAEEASDINAERAHRSQVRAEKALSGDASLTDEEFKKNQNRLQRSLIRQHLAGKNV